MIVPQVCDNTLTVAPAAVKCPRCGKAVLSNELLRDPGGTRCLYCNELVSVKEKREYLFSIVRRLIDVQTENEGGNGQNVVETADISRAIADEFGGAAGFGSKWGQMLLKMADERPGAPATMRAFADAARFFLKTEEFAHQKDFDDMTADEIRAAQSAAIQEWMKRIIHQQGASRLLDAIEVTAEELPVSIIRQLDPAQTVEPTIASSVNA
jgi:DNA-directed RNA polymerase subunit RPC12/RpoP